MNRQTLSVITLNCAFLLLLSPFSQAGGQLAGQDALKQEQIEQQGSAQEGFEQKHSQQEPPQQKHSQEELSEQNRLEQEASQRGLTEPEPSEQDRLPQESSSQESLSQEHTSQESLSQEGLSQERFDQGRTVFTEAAQPSCTLCHTLEDAGSAGEIGPNLNELQPDRERIINAVTGGVGIMPAFGESLSAEQIEAVATYVEQAAQQLAD